MAIDNVEFYPPADRGLGEMHIGMFFAWAVHRGHAAEEWVEDFGPVVQSRAGVPSDLASTCDGMLCDDQFGDPVLAFVRDYYQPERYFEDFARVVADDAWKSFDRLAPVLDQRLAAFQSTRSG